jgi:hypothetical protein
MFHARLVEGMTVLKVLLLTIPVNIVATSPSKLDLLECAVHIVARPTQFQVLLSCTLARGAESNARSRYFSNEQVWLEPFYALAHTFNEYGSKRSFLGVN